MAVTMAEITKLRNLTSAGLMDCKKALAETNGDIDAAVELLRQKGKAIAAKREDRQASEGCVLAKNDGNFAAVVALCCVLQDSAFSPLNSFSISFVVVQNKEPDHSDSLLVSTYNLFTAAYFSTI